MSAPQATRAPRTPRRKPVSPARQRLTDRLHCLKKEQGWDDDTYRDVLQKHTGKRSSTDLPIGELARVVAVIGGKEVRLLGGEGSADHKEDWSFIDRAIDEKRSMLRKIFAVCRDLGVGRTYAEGIARKQSGGAARRLEMMSVDELYKLVQAITTTQRSKAKQAAAAADPAAAQEVQP
jgi:phage gp16-like protein